MAFKELIFEWHLRCSPLISIYLSSYLGIAVGGCHQIDNCTRFKSGIRRSVQFQISSDQLPLLGKIICRNYSVEYLVSLEKNVLANSSYITMVGLVIIWSHRSIMRADGQTRP